MNVKSSPFGLLLRGDRKIKENISTPASLEVTLSGLNRLFDIFNEHYYKNKLIHPIIVIQSHWQRKRTMGWCTTKKIWKDVTTEDAFYEITIAAEFLYLDKVAVASTLLHEMVHLFCLQYNIKDTTRNGIYHNKKFKEAAEMVGLIVERDQTNGWAYTKPTPETEQFIRDNIKDNPFILTRGEPVGAGSVTATKTKKSNSRRYVCPKCGAIVRATKALNIVCGDCKIPFVEKDRTAADDSTSEGEEDNEV